MSGKHGIASGVTLSEVNVVGDLPPRYNFRAAIRMLVEASRFGVVIRFIVAHATVLGIVAYGYTVIYGALGSTTFYLETGINPWLFYGIEDFLMAGLKHWHGLLVPVLVSIFELFGMFLAAFLSTSMLVLFGPLVRWAVGQMELPPDRAELSLLMTQNFLTGILFKVGYSAAAIFLILYLVFLPVIGVRSSDARACAPMMRVSVKTESGESDGIKGGVKEPATQDRRLVGSTDKFLFLSTEDGSRYEVLPVETVKQIMPEAQQSPPLPLTCLLFQ